MGEPASGAVELSAWWSIWGDKSRIFSLVPLATLWVILKGRNIKSFRRPFYSLGGVRDLMVANTFCLLQTLAWEEI